MDDNYVKFEKQFKVTVYDVDHNGLLKLDSIFNYFQEAATLHSIELGVSYFDLLKVNEYWVLTRLCVEIDNYPKYSEQIKVITYPIAPRTFDCERDYYIVNERGDILVRGVSKWVILDLNTRQLKKIGSEKFPPELNLNPNRAIADPVWKVNCDSPSQKVCENFVGMNDIDFNLHMNNAKYISAAYNALSKEELKGRAVSSISVNYLKEMPLGQKYTIEKAITDDNSVVISFIKDDVASFKARLTFADNFERFVPGKYGF